MPVDPFKQFQPPQANAELPSWIQMDDQGSQAPDMSPFVTALKKRMGGNEMMKGGMDSMGGLGKAGGAESL